MRQRGKGGTAAKRGGGGGRQEVPPRASVAARSTGGAVPADPAADGFRIADYTFYRIARAGSLYSRRLERALKPRGMDQSHWRVLMILQEHEPASMGLIAEIAVMKLPTVVKLIQRMAETGYVRAAPRVSDQRVTEVGITSKGRRELLHVRRVAAEVYGAAIAGLAASDVARLNELLGHLERNLLDAPKPPRSPRRD